MEIKLNPADLLINYWSQVKQILQNKILLIFKYIKILSIFLKMTLL